MISSYCAVLLNSCAVLLDSRLLAHANATWLAFLPATAALLHPFFVLNMPQLA